MRQQMGVVGLFSKPTSRSDRSIVAVGFNPRLYRTMASSRSDRSLCRLWVVLSANLSYGLSHRTMKRNKVYRIISITTGVLGLIVLLLMFVTMRFRRFEKDMELSLPAPASGEAANVDRLVINVLTDKIVVFENQKVSTQTLLTKLKQVVADFPDQPVVIRAQKETEFSYVISVLNSITEAGISNVSFEAIEEKTLLSE